MQTNLSIPQCNPSALVANIKLEINIAIERVITSGPYILGEEVRLFEQEWAAWCGVNDAIGCASGTDGLELILRSLDLKSGARVLAPSHTAVATIAAIMRAGNRPMLADVDSKSYGLDPASVSRCLEQAIDDRDPVQAVIAVHLYGNPVDLDALLELCGRYDVPLIEDCSQAHGAKWKNKQVGGFGVAAAFSLYPTKNLGALGDAGVINCCDSARTTRLRRLRQYGWEQTAISEEPGMNSRLDPLQAAILRVKLKHLDDHNKHRKLVAGIYQEMLTNCPEIQLPLVKDEHIEPVYHQFVVQVPAPKRDLVRTRLSDLGIGTLIHYPQAAHQMPAYATKSWVGLDPKGLQKTEALLPRIISLPMGPHLKPEQVVHVAEQLLQVIK
jgi:dTDP-4-amino-4,6-dideoxygalactose transaminase